MAAPPPLWTEEYDEPEAWEPPPPPPPLEEIPHRPLFADHERRVPPGAPPPPPPRPPVSPTAEPDASSTGTHGNGTGTGTGSRYWPFEDEAEDSGSFSGREGRSWLKLAGIVALAIAVLIAMFVAFDIGRGNDPGPSATPSTTAPATPTETGSPIRVVAAQDFDPEGDDAENPDQVPLAIDGKPDTGWRTLTYRGNAQLGGLKSGVGLVLDLGSEQEVGSVEVGLVGSPTDLELFATPPGVNDPPADLADARRVAGITADTTTGILRAEPKVRTRFLVIWLTRLPAVTGGFRGEITEVTVRS